MELESESEIAAANGRAFACFSLVLFMCCLNIVSRSFISYLLGKSDLGDPVVV